MGKNHGKFDEITDSWNPITGCLHGCTYCVTKDTLVLTADLVWKPIQKIKIGDELLAFSEKPKEQYWHWEFTTVLGKIKRKLPVYRIETSEGEIKATSQHRWLTNRGTWEKTEQLIRWSRPIRFFAKPIAPLEFTEKYVSGYLAGLMGGYGIHQADGMGRNHENSSSFRTASSNVKVLHRIKKFLRILGVSSGKKCLLDANEEKMFKWETWNIAAEKIIDSIREIEHYDFYRGFLAGAFDADGSFNNMLKISSHDENILRNIKRYGGRLGFEFIIEDGNAKLKGEMDKILEFFSATNPIIRGKKGKFKAIKSFRLGEILRIEKLGEEEVYDIATSSHTFIANGFASHNCWARNYAKRLAAMGVEPYKTRVFEPSLIEWRLRSKIPKGRFIFVSDMGDMWGCYDEETEVLTYDGWKRFSEVTYDDLIACLDPFSDKVVYCKPNRIIKYWYEGKMVRIKSNLIDLLVTPDHNLYVALRATSYKERKQGIKFRSFSLVRAGDCLRKGMKFRRDFPSWEGHEINEFMGVPINVFVKFLGYYLAEGTASIIKNKPRIQIAQKNTSPHYNDILEVLKAVAKSRGKNVYAYEDRIVIYGDQELTEWLRKLGHGHEKCIPVEFKKLSKRLLSMMLETYVNCDDYRQSETCKRIYTTSKRFADDIQEAALKCGYIAIVKTRGKRQGGTINGKVVAGKHDCYEVIISKRYKMPEVDYTRNIRAANRLGIKTRCYVGYEDYEGYVYCVEVPTHIIYVRRNGRPAWCGNSWVPREWIERVLRVVRSKPRSWFFFLTKNPKRYLEFEGELPNNVVLGATIETNRDYKLTKAPAPRERYESMVKLNWRWKAVVIEPILDFDGEFIDWIYNISPVIVYVGYDNYNNRLPEPKLEKTMILLEALRGVTDLRPKTIRKAWHET
jgi:protein gp37